MAVRRAGTLHHGDRVRYQGNTYTVLSLTGTLLRLAQEFRRAPDLAVHLADLFADPDFAILGSRDRTPLPPSGVLDGLPTHVVEQARWWEQHVLEVIHGVPGQAPPGTAPRPEYDPARTSLAARERAKAAELTAAGFAAPAIRVKRQRQRYEAGGLQALVDGRSTRRVSRTGRADPRVVDAMHAAIGEAEQASSRTASYFLWRTQQILAERHGADAPPMPPRRSAFRLFAALADRHTTGSARTRQSLANQPEGVFSALQVDAPGEVMQIDSTALDVLVLLADGVIGSVELTGMIDVATRTVTAGVLSPTTKSVDASVLLARTVTPEPMRPGWVEALRMAYSVLPHRRLLDIDDRLDLAAARPVIVPDTIVCDHGRVFISDNFRSSCRFLGISFQPTHQAAGSEKPNIERFFSTVGTQFAQFVSGYKGANTQRRGYRVEDQPLWSLMELQALLDEWLVACWQNRPHDGLRDPQTPGRMFTPNEKYAAMVEAAGYVPVALSANDYVELLPATWRAINSYGVRVRHRTYDAEQLNPWRKQPSGIAAKRHLWEVHCDPYDAAHVWVRHPDNQGWVTLTWKHLHRAPIPFGDLAWNHVRGAVPAHSTEADIADAVQQLLVKASQEPTDPQPAKLSARDRRVAARTAATAPATRRRPTAPPADAGISDAGTSDAETSDTSKDASAAQTPVVPLEVFDPYKEAAKRW